MVQRVYLAITNPLNYCLIFLNTREVICFENGKINKHDILHDCQFGFRAGRSPCMALLSLIKNITTSLDAHKHAVGVFMDIEKAFDTIYQNIYLRK